MLLRFMSYLLLFCAAPVWGQTNVGLITGTVSDSSGSVLVGATVVARNQGTGSRQTVRTDATGSFVFPGLAAGTYQIRFEHPGFKSVEQQGVVLDSGSTRPLSARLEIGQMTESVTVDASAEQVQTTSGSIGRVIDDRQVSQIAMNGRQYTQLLRLTPGVAATTLNVFNPQTNVSQQAVNGVRSLSNFFTVDGAPNLTDGGNGNSLVDPNVDALAEVKMETSAYAAEFGGRGGALINLVTKSGTQEFHGSLFYFVRNNRFDARSFFDRSLLPLRFNDFGGTLGGPIYIPGKYNTAKDKLFFFYSQEWKYTRQGQTTVNVVPSALERAGDFNGSSLAAPIDPLNNTPFPNRIVPASRWSANGPRLLRPIPLPNFPGPGGNFASAGSNRTDYREELMRIDYNLTPKNLFSYKLVMDSWNILFAFRNNSLPIVPNPRNRPGYLTSLSWQSTLSPTMINYAMFSAGHTRITGDPDVSAITRPALGLTIPELYPLNRSNVAPAVSIAGFVGYNSNDRIRSGQTPFQFRDDFTKVAGSHTLKAGIFVIRSRMNENTNVRDEGQVTFNTAALGSTRNVLADVLLGTFQQYQEWESDSFYRPRYWTVEMYAQDKWRVSRRLTLDLGIRYNILKPATIAQGNVSTWLPRFFTPANAPRINPANGALVPGSGDPYNGIAIWGSEFPEQATGRLPQASDASLKRLFRGLPAGGYPMNWNNWGPRVGLAYDVFGNGRTAIRTGFGIFYDRVPSNTLSGNAQNPPFVNVASIFDGNIDRPAGGVARDFPANINAWPDRLKDPSIMSYNFGFQHQLPSNVILDVNYVGNVGRHLPYTLNLNQLPVGTQLSPPNSTTNVNALRPYLGYSNITMRERTDTSNYNGLQVNATRRFDLGLSFGVAYTFSKTMDKFGGTTPQDSYAPALDIARANIDIPHILSVNYIYELPFFKKSGNPFQRTVLGGWGVAGVTAAQSGAPVSVNVPTDIARIGSGASRATLIGNPLLAAGERTPGRWFNTAAFQAPSAMTPGIFGNSGRNILRGPGFQNWDVTLLKTFIVQEKMRLQFRAESFNVLNHANFTSINTTVAFNAAGVASNGFGGVNGAGPGRVMEFALKLLF
jgi:hypothetical protein